jgi:ribose transport system substrate-binding protein
MVELHRAGSLPKARLRGIQTGIAEIIRVPERCRISSVDGDGQFQTTLERVRKHLRESKAKRVLVGAANDSSALGALRAYEEAGRASECAIVGQNAEPEARAELRTGNTRLIASIAYFPEKYGDGLLKLALELLSRKVVPPAVFTTHQTITPDNVDHFYPNDSLLTPANLAQN